MNKEINTAKIIIEGILEGLKKAEKSNKKEAGKC